MSEMKERALPCSLPWWGWWGWWAGGVGRLGWIANGGPAPSAPGPTRLAFCLQGQEMLDLAGLALLRTAGREQGQSHLLPHDFKGAAYTGA